jgi:hypothetical protein
MNKFVVLFSVTMCLFITGCLYDVPEYVNIEPSQSAFLIPLEGEIKDQVKFASEESLKKAQVAARRVQITHRWLQTGYWWFNGQYIPNVLLITVDRQPVTREWTADSTTGTSSKSEAIWVESKDSVGFSAGVTVSSMIKEEDAALFLYRYPSGSLAKIMDTEVRARIQAMFSDYSAGWDMSDLRGRKSEIASYIRNDAMPFFRERGITITTIGLTGGFTYENKKIQESIDEVFIAQRKKEINKALLEAQRDANLRITQEADAMAEKEQKIAAGTANGQKKLLEVAQAASKDQTYVELRKLEVEMERVRRWDGKCPTMMMGSNPSMMLSLPLPGDQPSSARAAVPAESK